jgi:hypothetical protein
MSELHLTPEDLPGARRVLAHLQRLLAESTGHPAPTPYQSTIRFLIDDVHSALHRRPMQGCSISRERRQEVGARALSGRSGPVPADALLRLELDLLRLFRDYRRRLGGGHGGRFPLT